MVNAENKPFLQFNDYKNFLNKENSTGIQPTFNAESDLRIKKFVTNTFGNDNIIRKMMMLNFVKDGILDKTLADIYILKRLGDI